MVASRQKLPTGPQVTQHAIPAPHGAV